MKYLLAGISVIAALALNELNLSFIRDQNPHNTGNNTVSTLRNVTVWSVDNEYYISPPDNFLAGKGWRRTEAVGPAANFRRVPGYSLLYFSCVSLFGPNTGLFILKYFQLFLFALSVIAIHGICTLYFGSQTALWVTGLYGFTPFFSSFTAFTLTESITPSLMVFYLFFLAKAQHTTDLKKTMSYMAASFFIGAAILTRPYMGIAGILLPAFIIMDYKRDIPALMKNLVVCGCLPVLMIAGWGMRNYLSTGEPVMLEKAYHPTSIDRFKPEFRGLFRFVKSWGEDGTFFNTYQLPMWAAARMGDTGFVHIRKTIDAWPENVVAQFGEKRLTDVLRKYQEASLAQHPYIMEMKPMPGTWLPVQIEAEEMFNTLTEEFRSEHPVEAYVIAPFRYLKRMVVHSNTSHIFLFQEPFRGNIILNGMRYFLALLHFLLYVSIPMAIFKARRNLRLLFIAAVPVIAIIFFCFFHREVEQRYMLPFLPLVVVGIGALRLKIDDSRIP